MKKLLVLLTISFLILDLCKSQVQIPLNQERTEKEFVVSIDPTFFVLGTLRDYMGRYDYINSKEEVDNYYPYEKPIAIFLSKYIKSELNITVDTVFEKSGHCTMKSKQLAKSMNSFYNENTELLENKFKTKEQIYSFLAGVYSRNGEKLDSSIYKIQLANSPKHQNCYQFLKQVGCENIFYQRLKTIPTIFILYFEPTAELKKYLDFVEPQRKELKESYNNTMNTILKGHIKQEKIDSLLNKNKIETLKKIKPAFERP